MSYFPQLTAEKSWTLLDLNNRSFFSLSLTALPFTFFLGLGMIVHLDQALGTEVEIGMFNVISMLLHCSSFKRVPGLENGKSYINFILVNFKCCLHTLSNPRMVVMVTSHTNINPPFIVFLLLLCDYSLLFLSKMYFKLDWLKCFQHKNVPEIHVDVFSVLRVFWLWE